VTEERCLEKNERMGLDCFVAVAIGGSALIGGVTSAVGSHEAASAQTNAADQAAAIQQQQYAQNSANQQPDIAAGHTALNTIGQDQANGTGFAASFTPQNYINTPGYQFQQQQGENAVNSSAAATGGVLNGGSLKALDQYTTGLANSTYSQAYQNYLAGSAQSYSQLYGVASLGENAAASLGAQGVTSTNNQGNYLTQAGNAQAAGDVGVANGINSAVSGASTLGYLANQSSQSGYARPSVGYNPATTSSSSNVNLSNEWAN
jgi:hypothetical protein